MNTVRIWPPWHDERSGTLIGPGGTRQPEWLTSCDLARTEVDYSDLLDRDWRCSFIDQLITNDGKWILSFKKRVWVRPIAPSKGQE